MAILCGAAKNSLRGTATYFHSGVEKVVRFLEDNNIWWRCVMKMNDDDSVSMHTDTKSDCQSKSRQNCLLSPFVSTTEWKLAIYALMIYTAPCVMFLMRADPLRGQARGGWALEIKIILGLWNGIEAIGKCHLGPKNTRFPGPNPLPLAQVMDMSASKIIKHRNL